MEFIFNLTGGRVSMVHHDADDDVQHVGEHRGVNVNGMQIFTAAIC